MGVRVPHRVRTEEGVAQYAAPFLYQDKAAGGSARSETSHINTSSMAKGSKDTETWELMRDMLQQYLRPQLRLVIPAVVAGVMAASAVFALPMIIKSGFPIVFGTEELPRQAQDLLARYVQPEDMEKAKLWAVVLLIPLLMLARGFGTYFNTYLLAKAGTNMLRHLWVDLFTRLQTLSFSYFDRNKRGELMTTVIQFAQNIQNQLVHVSNDLIIQPLTLVFALAYLVYASITSRESAMLLVNLAISALVVPLVRVIGKSMIKKMRSSLSGLKTVTATVEETLTAQREVRAFNLEQRQANRLYSLIVKYNNKILMMTAWRQSLAPAIEIVSALALAYSLYQGCGDGLTLEQFAAIATAFYFCYDPLKRLGESMNQVQIMGVMVHALNSILHAKDETPEPAEPRALPRPVQGEVVFDKVSFAYTKAKMVLKDISVHVKPGEIVALVGPSGSGKTTFINLICRFYDVSKGRVMIDGVDVRELAREDRVRSIGLVSQFSALFRDTILENIRIGRPGASRAEVKVAGDCARVTEFAEARPEGYDYVLAEGGGGLSGGQRQRVSIARAFLKNAPILILDEATSALDMKSEAYIQEALEELAHGHTTFIIAHRFSTIRMAQRILVFEEGRIIADGAHAALYESCELYKSLYDEQVRQAAREHGEEVCA